MPAPICATPRSITRSVCARDKAAAGRRVGFVHIPATLARPGGPNRGRTGACPLTWDRRWSARWRFWLRVSGGRGAAISVGWVERER